MEHHLVARTEELAAFFDLTLLAGQGVNLPEVFEQVLPRIIEVTHSRAVCIHLFDADRTALRLAAQQNLVGDVQTQLQAVELPAAFQRWLQQPNDPLITTALSGMITLPSALRVPEFQTYLGAQIRIGQRTEGMLSCFRFSDRGFGVDEIALVTALAEQMGMMLETDRLRQDAKSMAVLEERQRLARDLHNSVTQSLYSLSLFSRAGREAAEDGDTERLRHSLTELERNTLHALREMRLLLYELRPADLEQEGLIRAVELRLNTVERRVGLKLDVQLDELPGMSPSHEVELYHIILEALNNIVKHAAAGRLTLQLTHANGQIHLRIVDDGQGFDPIANQRRAGVEKHPRAGSPARRPTRHYQRAGQRHKGRGRDTLSRGGELMSDLIRILIADDHFVVRQGLAALLAPRNGMEVVGEAATGREAVDRARVLQPDVILMDMMMPEMDGPEAIALIKQENPAARILVLTSFGESKQISAAIQAGALGYLLKDSSPDDLLHAIQSVYRGNLVLPQDLALKLMQPQPAAAALDQLTERETDVLRLLAKGQSNQEIAAALNIGMTTVRSHVSNILMKLNVSNRTQAALVAQERQLL